MNLNLVGTLYKDAAEQFSASVDFSNWLASGDTISTHTVSCYSGSTNNTATMIGTTTDDNDDQVTFLVKAGTAGAIYLITVTATTVAADVWVAEINCVVN